MKCRVLVGVCASHDDETVLHCPHDATHHRMSRSPINQRQFEFRNPNSATRKPTHTQMIRREMILLLFLFLVTVMNRCKADGFETVGELHFFIGTNEPVKSKFKVQVNSCNWLIQVSDDPYYPFLEESMIASDGTNLFQVDVFKDKPDPYATNKIELASSGGKTLRAPQVNWIANVKIGNVPDYNHHHNSLLWLAFASGCYLSHTATNQLPCVVVRPRNKSECSVKATWTLHGKDPAVLLAATVFDEGKVGMLNGEVFDRPKPFDGGFTNLVYSVSAFTNIGAAKVPLQFRLEMFEPRHDAHSSADITTSWRLDGFVERTAAAISSDFTPPQIRERTRVEDFRAAEIASVKSVIYYTTNGWLTTNHPAFNSLISGVPYAPRESTVKRYVVGIMILTSLIFFAVLWKLKRQSNTKGTTTRTTQ